MQEGGDFSPGWRSFVKVTATPGPECKPPLWLSFLLTISSCMHKHSAPTETGASEQTKKTYKAFKQLCCRLRGKAETAVSCYFSISILDWQVGWWLQTDRYMERCSRCAQMLLILLELTEIVLFLHLPFWFWNWAWTGHVSLGHNKNSWHDSASNSLLFIYHLSEMF